MLLLSLHLYTPGAAALDIDTFEVASSAFDARGGMQVESPTLGWPGAAYGGLALVYAHAPLVRVFEDGTQTSVVNDSFATHLAAGYTLLGKVRIGLDLPLYPYVGGNDSSSRSGFAFGDAKLRGVIGIPVGEATPWAVAVIPTLSLPTGQPLAFTGSGGVAGGLAVAGGYQASNALRFDANLGFRAGQRAALGDQSFGANLDLGVGGTYAVRPEFSVGLELDGKVAVADGLGQWAENPFELHAYGKYGKEGGLQALLGLGTALVGGVGGPDVRVIGGVGYRAPGKEPIRDADGDGIYDDTDSCIDIPEDIDGFEDTDGCPDDDNDRDGIPDSTDACPDQPEDRDGFQDLDGCPDPDNDQDGVLDVADACPDEAGPAATNGCPDRDGDTVIDREDQCPDVAGDPALGGCPDRDHDKVPEPRDQCPDEPIDPREDPSRSNGCPRRVFVTMDKIEILEKVYFDTGKTSIKKQSFDLLADVAKVLNDNSDIEQIEVAGHTDSVGRDSTNLKLSQGRAEAVVEYLATVGGVARSRLKAVGYGETMPIDTNATETGRGNNRRVEFVIKALSGKKAPLGTMPMPTRPTVQPQAPAPAATPAPAPAPAPAPKAPAPNPAPKAPSGDPFGLDGE